MKAIYINLDPYLAAFAAWLKGGKVGTAPSFNPIPLAVTVPLGEDVGYFGLGWEENEEATVDGQSLTVILGDWETQGAIQNAKIGGLSPLMPSAKYFFVPISGDSEMVDCSIYDGDGTVYVPIRFTVLVRRETASGPVDLVDFTPPVSLSGVSFAGVDIEGAEFDGNEIVANADTGALSAPAAGG